MKDLTPLEAGRWMDAAPQIVQDTVTSPTTEQSIEQIGRQYSLHVDMIGVLAKLTNYMLLGYVGPEESFQELRLAGVPDQQARQIIDEVNKKIFVPLHDKMRSGTAATLQQSKPVMPQPRPVTASVPRYGAPISPQGNTVRPVQPQQRPAVSYNIPMRPQTIGAPKPMTGNRMLEDHEESHIEFKKPSTPHSQGFSQRNTTPPPAPMNPPVRPTNVPQGRNFAPPLQSPMYSRPENKFPAEIPQGSTIPKASPPQNLPGMMQPGVIPPGGRPTFTATTKMEPPPSSIPPVPPKSYSSDPYREPLE